MNILKKFNYLIFEKSSVILVLFFPIFLVSGPFLSDLTVILLSIFFFFNFSKFKFNSLIIFLLLFYLTINLTNIFSFDPIISYEKTIPYVRFILFVLVFSYLFEKYQNYQKYFFFIIFFVFSFLIITSLLIYISDFVLLGKTPNRLGLIYRDEKILGSITVRLIPFLFVSIYFFSKKYKSLSYKLLYIFLIFASFFLIILSGERSALLLLILFIFLYLIFVKDFFIKKLLLKAFGILLFVILFLQMFLGINNLNRYDIFYDAVQKKSISYLAHAHSNHFSTAVKMFKSKPLTGHGTNSFIFKCNENEFHSGNNSCSTHPHNLYLQLLAENGLLSFLLILGFFAFVLLKLISLRLKEKSHEYLIPFKLILISIILNFWPIISTGSFFNNYMSCYFFFSIALLNYYQNKKY